MLDDESQVLKLLTALLSSLLLTRVVRLSRSHTKALSQPNSIIWLEMHKSHKERLGRALVAVLKVWGVYEVNGTSNPPRRRGRSINTQLTQN